MALAGVGVKPAQAAAAASALAGAVSRSSTKVVHQFLEKVTIAFLMDHVGNVCCRETKVLTVPGYSTPQSVYPHPGRVVLPELRHDLLHNTLHTGL